MLPLGFLKTFRANCGGLSACWLWPLLLGLLAADRAAGEALPAITLIIDDMGYHDRRGKQALAMEGAVTYAFLPHTPYAYQLAEQANSAGKEVMLHLPMAAHDATPLGPGGLTMHMTEAGFKQTLALALEALPHVAGLNNHMGSLLTRHPGAMAWLMQELALRPGLYFIDSRTTYNSVAQQLAQEHGVPNTRRDVFLDNDRDPAEIARNFTLLVEQARREGAAVGIAHPYPETVAVLGRELSRLSDYGVRLISASEMVALQERNKPWLESSSRSPKVAKNSRR